MPSIVLIPVPMRDFLKINKTSYPELFDKYRNFDIKSFYFTDEGKQYLELCPVKTVRDFNSKKEILNYIFWELLYYGITYNKNYYIYIVNTKWFDKNITGTRYSHINTEKEITENSIPINQRWYNGDEHRLNEVLENFINSINLNEKPVWELRINGMENS